MILVTSSKTLSKSNVDYFKIGGETLSPYNINKLSHVNKKILAKKLEHSLIDEEYIFFPDKE